MHVNKVRTEDRRTPPAWRQSVLSIRQRASSVVEGGAAAVAGGGGIHRLRASKATQEELSPAEERLSS